MRNEAVKNYVKHITNNCSSCRATATPQPSRMVSISSRSKTLNSILCVDHFYFDKTRLFHVMDLTPRYSAAFCVSNATMNEAVLALESCWMNQFWIPDSILADEAFMPGSFGQFCNERRIKLSMVPPKRHSENQIESKYGTIRTIFL